MTRDDTAPSRELATVTNLPARQVVDAEIVTEEEWAAAASQRARALARRDTARHDAVTVVEMTRKAVTHDRTVAGLRHGWFVIAGAGVILRRVWDAKTNSRYERVMRGAEALGDMERLQEWEARAEAANERRHRRRMDWVRAPLDLVKAGVLLLCGVVGVLIALGVVLAIGAEDPGMVLAPLQWLVTLIVTVTWVVTVVWGPLVLVAPWVLVAVCWRVGRHAAVTPAWLAPTGQRRDNEPITPSTVVTAFRDLGIAPLRKAVTAMGDAGAGMLSPIRVAGCGVEVDVTLPSGVSTGEILARRQRLAQNLGRHEHEVFPVVAPAPRTVRVWAADSGALDEPIGPSPLVLDHDLRADYRRGKAPWGVDLRGDPVVVSLYQRHLLITGLSNQGKTRAMLALALWLALDPRVEFWIADLKGINADTKQSDWEPLRGIATRYVAGPTDEHVAEVADMLEAAVAEMNRRIQDGGEWTPLTVWVDEIQVAYMCPAKDASGRLLGGSKDTSRVLRAVRQIQNQGRVVDVLLYQGTQNPTNQNLPVLAREGAHLRICLAVGKEEQARMALGDNPVDAGAAPHRLRPGLDRGTLVVAGDGAPLQQGQLSVTVRTHYIDGPAAMEIAARAQARRAPVRRVVDAEVVRDLLDDVAEALGDDEMVRATSVADRLRERIDHRDYRTLNGTMLAERLRGLGVEVRQKDGIPVVRRDRVRAAIDRRERDR